MEERPNYYAIIPANIRYDNTLPPNAKLLYGEITALCNKDGYCHATNEYFAKLYSVSTRTITEWIKKLEDKNYIYTNVETKRYEDGTIKKIRKICINHIEVLQQNHIEVLQQNHIEENFSYNNTRYNNINNNIYIVVQYLNEKAKTNYKYNTVKTKTLINARLNEGFTIEDFKKVIDIKTNEWGNDSVMNKYLRPETLFGTKFESYLNQKDNRPSCLKEVIKEEKELTEEERKIYEEITNSWC